MNAELEQRARAAVLASPWRDYHRVAVLVANGGATVERRVWLSDTLRRRGRRALAAALVASQRDPAGTVRVVIVDEQGERLELLDVSRADASLERRRLPHVVDVVGRKGNAAS